VQTDTTHFLIGSTLRADNGLQCHDDWAQGKGWYSIAFMGRRMDPLPDDCNIEFTAAAASAQHRIANVPKV